jgi:cytochrome c oxidase subunit 2
MVQQSALRAAGVQAERIEHLWWLMFWVTLVVTLLVLGMLALAVWRGRQHAQPQSPSGDPKLLTQVGLATAATVVILFGLLVASVLTSRSIASQRDESALIIDVTAYQWWWNVEYQHPEPAQRVRTANEIHLPAGRTVAIKLLSTDVIHSFWVPALHGKLDAIPGHATTLWLRADTPGVYRGQCAEYCGAQHAHMGLVVIVEPAEEFERWIQAQRVTAPPPSTAIAARGLHLVETGSCALCHTVRGTMAGGRQAPDLTHLASRSTIAAATLPRTNESVDRWIADPHGIKPGTRMPTIGLSADDRRAIVAYLEQLR